MIYYSLAVSGHLLFDNLLTNQRKNNVMSGKLHKSGQDYEPGLREGKESYFVEGGDTKKAGIIPAFLKKSRTYRPTMFSACGPF